MSGHSPDHRPISEVLYCHCRPGHCDCTDARVAAAEMNAVFDLRWKADRRATEAWQAAHPGNDLVWPDHADMVTWLLERDAILRAAAHHVLRWYDETSALGMSEPLSISALRAALEGGTA